MAEKQQSKAAVAYGKGVADAHCGICRHYHQLTQALGSCSLVAGRISRTAWCKLFVRAS